MAAGSDPRGRPEQIVVTLHRAGELDLLAEFYEASESHSAGAGELLEKIRTLAGPCLYPEAFSAARIARCPSVLACLLRASERR